MRLARSILKTMLIHGIQPLMMSWLSQGWKLLLTSHTDQLLIP